MSAHTGDNRLDTFVLKPAPIQISYCGYPNSSGIRSMDYRITDKYCDSEKSQKYYQEKFIFKALTSVLNQNYDLDQSSNFSSQGFNSLAYLLFEAVVNKVTAKGKKVRVQTIDPKKQKKATAKAKEASTEEPVDEPKPTGKKKKEKQRKTK